MDINQLTNQQPKRNNRDCENIITIIALTIFTPLGLILMWVISDWTKKVKVVTTIILLLLTLLLVAVFLLGNTAITSFKEDKASDARIVSVISMSQSTMDFFKSTEGSLDNFNCQYAEMRSLCDEVKSQKSELQIIKNSMNDQACIYAKMHKKNQWYCVDSNKGCSGYATVDPQSNGYCVEGAVNVSCPPY